MQAPVSAQPGAKAATVTVGLLNGQCRGGRLTVFYPTFTDLPLTNENGGERTARHMIPAETVAYVAFHRGADERPLTRVGRPLRVTVVGGKTFRVRADPPDRSNIGFFATPDDSASPFREFFFYNAGVRVLERAEPLGTLLVERGAASADHIEMAVAAQVEDRHRPLGEILVEQSKVSSMAVADAVDRQGREGMRLGELLVTSGIVTDVDVTHALIEQKRRRGRRLGEIMVAMGMLTEVDLAHTLASKFHLPFLDLEATPIDPAAATALPRPFIEKHRVLPIAIDERVLTVAIADPLAVDVVDNMMIHAKRKIREVIATPSQIDKAVKSLLGDTGRKALDEILSEIDSKMTVLRPKQVDPSTDPAEPDGLVVRLVNQILLDACRRGASDIHVEPSGNEQPTVIRLRIDGDCTKYRELPGFIGAQLVARLKIMAELDIAERRRSQDGKLKLQDGARTVELRLATIPTVNGNEDAVLRILADSKPMPLDSAGLSVRNLAELKKLVARPYGLVLCVGPTGSGKTTTLHAMLGFINTADTKIWTAEDPVEITQPGLRQVQVHPKIGLTFAAALRTFLRADPDVIMVGEMRDVETASTAIEASLTGHLVLSTLHTNSAPETITRLLDMGLDPFNFADALLGVLAQRLARSLCASCREPHPGTIEEWERFARNYGLDAFANLHPYGPSFRVWRAPGCPACRGTGYRGRIALHELLVCDDDLRQTITHRRPAAEIRTAAVKNGMTTLLQDGIEKALAGLTDLTQVLAAASR